jgi:hypothetical protein
MRKGVAVMHIGNHAHNESGGEENHFKPLRSICVRPSVSAFRSVGIAAARHWIISTKLTLLRLIMEVTVSNRTTSVDRFILPIELASMAQRSDAARRDTKPASPHTAAGATPVAR